ncbi:MAG: hypothetical protein KF734_07340 [Saprospiraceae bacterium]|nr:hypothetical protein [Saprospiraceae bacterium]
MLPLPFYGNENIAKQASYVLELRYSDFSFRKRKALPKKNSHICPHYWLPAL